MTFTIDLRIVVQNAPSVLPEVFLPAPQEKMADNPIMIITIGIHNQEFT